MIRNILFMALVLSFMSCQTSWRRETGPEMTALVDRSLFSAGQNAVELSRALEEAPKWQKAGVAFLIAYMPEKDLKSLTADFILENTAWAYKARENFPWCKELPEDIFLNEVLPYANLQEVRDPWRPGFYGRFEPYVRECKDIYAVSYKPGDCFLPLSWRRNDSIIHALNVTGRYIALYEEQLRDTELKEDEVLVDVVLSQGQGSDPGTGRLHRKVSVLQDGLEFTFGFTPSPTDDLNKYLIVKLKKNTTYQFAVFGPDITKTKETTRTIGPGNNQIIKLFLN